MRAWESQTTGPPVILLRSPAHARSFIEAEKARRRPPRGDPPRSDTRADALSSQARWNQGPSIDEGQTRHIAWIPGGRCRLRRADRRTSSAVLATRAPFNLRRSATRVIRRCGGIGSRPSPFGTQQARRRSCVGTPGLGAGRDVPCPAPLKGHGAAMTQSRSPRRWGDTLMREGSDDGEPSNRSFTAWASDAGCSSQLPQLSRWESQRSRFSSAPPIESPSTRAWGTSCSAPSPIQRVQMPTQCDAGSTDPAHFPGTTEERACAGRLTRGWVGDPCVTSTSPRTSGCLGNGASHRRPRDAPNRRDEEVRDYTAHGLP